MAEHPKFKRIFDIVAPAYIVAGGPPTRWLLSQEGESSLLTTLGSIQDEKVEKKLTAAQVLTSLVDGYTLSNGKCVLNTALTTNQGATFMTGTARNRCLSLWCTGCAVFYCVVLWLLWCAVLCSSCM